MLPQSGLDPKSPFLKITGAKPTSHDGRTFSHWRASVLMFIILTAGILCALAHHFFYHYLDGRFVDSFILSQAWVNNIATALTFITKLMFVVVCNMAYTQLQWSCLRRSEHELRQVDTLTGITGDALLFRDVKTWSRRPILLSMAVVGWLLPIAAIFTPGTLTVQHKQLDKIEHNGVPLIDYDNMDAFVQTANNYTYNQPTIELTRIAMTTATLGEILIVPSSSQNQSYQLKFNGPALRCAVSSNQGLFGVALRNKQNQVIQLVSESSMFSWYYMAFVPDDDRMLLSTNMTAYEDTDHAYREFRTLDVVSSDTARIYVLPGPIERTSLIECQLYNATYITKLSLNLPGQIIEIEDIHYLNPVNATLGTCNSNMFYTLIYCDIGKAHPPDHMAYQAIMDAFGRIIAGTQQAGMANPGRTNESIATSRHLTVVDWASTESARQGLEELFHNITLSAMSSSSMSSLTLAPNPVEVSIRTYPNAYRYNAGSLLIAYGVSILVSIVCTMVGVYAIWLNQASYHNCFSTFIRATCRTNTDGDSWLDKFDQGADPLPQKVGVLRVQFGEECRSSTTDIETESPILEDRRPGATVRLPSLNFECESELRLLPNQLGIDDTTGI